MVRRALAALLLALVALPQTVDGQAPWRLDFEHRGLERVSLRGPRGLDVAHYFMVYEVSNPGEVEVPLALYFSVQADPESQRPGGKVRDLGSAKVVEAVRSAEARRGGTSDIKARGELPRTLEPGGKVTGIAVFGPLDRNADAFAVDVIGLRDVIVTRNGTDQFEKWALRILFDRPGDAAGADRAPVKFVKESWVNLSDSP